MPADVEQVLPGGLPVDVDQVLAVGVPVVWDDVSVLVLLSALVLAPLLVYIPTAWLHHKLCAVAVVVKGPDYELAVVGVPADQLLAVVGDPADGASRSCWMVAVMATTSI